MLVLDNIGFYLNEHDEKWNLGTSGNEELASSHYFNTYNDHRMAMAFAPLVCTLGEMIIEDPEVVSKSFPRYWDEVRKLGVGF
jgi:3-phosphoshikimate 1-carboxyvinyltransferase